MWRESWRKNDWTPKWLGATVGQGPELDCANALRECRNRAAPESRRRLSGVFSLPWGPAFAEATEREMVRLGVAEAVR
jgi:hypothetical protein